MTKKRIAKPLSIDIAPNSKKIPQRRLDLGLVKYQANRKMIAMRMRPAMIDMLNDVRKKVSRKAKHVYSQSAIVEMAIVLAKRTDINYLISNYIDSLKL